jgi:hypothetical protein
MSTTSRPDDDGMSPFVEPDGERRTGQSGSSSIGASETVGIWSSLLVLARRWPVVVLGLNLTLAAGVVAVKVVPTSYAASGTLLINLPPEPDPDAPRSGSTVQMNPYIGTRNFVGDLLITIMSDTDAEARVVARGGTGAYKTTLSLGDAALVKVDTMGQTRAEAMATWTATADETKEALVRLQRAKNVPDDQLITAEPLTRPLEAKRESGSRIRALIIVFVLGFGITVLVTFGAESLSQFRRLRRRVQSIGGRDRGEGRASPNGIAADEPEPSPAAPPVEREPGGGGGGGGEHPGGWPPAVAGASIRRGTEPPGPGPAERPERDDEVFAPSDPPGTSRRAAPADGSSRRTLRPVPGRAAPDEGKERSKPTNGAGSGWPSGQAGPPAPSGPSGPPHWAGNTNQR